MCRWFAYISNSEPAVSHTYFLRRPSVQIPERSAVLITTDPPPQLLEDVLVSPPHSITKAVNDSKRESKVMTATDAFGRPRVARKRAAKSA